MVDYNTVMADDTRPEDKDERAAKVLAEVKKAEHQFAEWHDVCDTIDEVYGRFGNNYIDSRDYSDPDYDLFWSSMEIMKPAVYAQPPKPVVSPKFHDRDPVKNVTSEMLERVAETSIERDGIDEVMQGICNDLIFYNRGQVWITYESDSDGKGQRVCYEHIDRKDFGHEPARKWADVGFVWRRAWLTKDELKDRFGDKATDIVKPAGRTGVTDIKSEGLTDKCPVYEVWHKRDKKVYWVAEGYNGFLDEGEPHLDLKGFFPCPRPAYGTLRPRTLEPVPDYLRYSSHFNKINKLTARIYLLLDQIKMKGLIPAGGDIGNAIEQLLQENDDSLIIPVPGAALVQSGGSFVTWMPLNEIATAIQGLIAARTQLIEDFYQLSGISDIMRGATEAQETLGAQQLKSQYGSVRIRQKVTELQRIARDTVAIASEIIAEHFSKETLLEMSQMSVPTKAEIDKEIKEHEKLAEEEMRALGEQMEQAVASGQADPAQLQQQVQQQQQEIAARHAPQIKKLTDTVPIEAVMDLLRDDKARCFAFEIETDSTIMTDEMQEKAQRAEFLQVFMGAGAQLQQMAQLGEPGVMLASEMLRFAIAPYRVGRQLDRVIDEFIDAAPQMAQQQQAQNAEQGDNQEAAMALAEAEMAKAQAQTAKVQADAQLKMQEIQLRGQEAAAKVQADQQRFALEIQAQRSDIEKTRAEIEKIFAEIQKMGFDVRDKSRTQDREDVKTAADLTQRAVDTVQQSEQRQIDNQFRAADAAQRSQEVNNNG